MAYKPWWRRVETVDDLELTHDNLFFLYTEAVSKLLFHESREVMDCLLEQMWATKHGLMR